MLDDSTPTGTGSSDDLPRPPAGRRSATRPAGPPAPVANPTFSDQGRRAVVEPAATESAAEVMPTRTRRTRIVKAPADSSPTPAAAETTRPAEAIVSADAATIDAAEQTPAKSTRRTPRTRAVKTSPAEGDANKTIPAQDDADQASPAETGSTRRGARGRAEGTTRTRAANTRGRNTAKAHPLDSPEDIGSGVAADVDAALAVAEQAARGRRRTRATTAGARTLVGGADVPTDEHGAVSAQAVLDSIAAAIAGSVPAATGEADASSPPDAEEAVEAADAVTELAGEDLTAAEAVVADTVDEETEPTDDVDTDGADEDTDDDTDEDADEDSEDHATTPQRRRRRRGGRRRRRSSGEPVAESSADVDDADTVGTDGTVGEEVVAESDESGSESESDGESSIHRRRRRRRRRGEDAGSNEDDPSDVVVRVREPRVQNRASDEVTGIEGSTRMEAKRQRRREGRAAGRRRAPILTESEFLARRESVDRQMIIRQREDYTQIAVLEDDILVEHYVDRSSATSLIGNIYLGKVQNVLPSMEAAFIDIGRGRNAVLYAGEIDWDAFGVQGNNRRVEQVFSSGQTVLVQVSKDPVGAKGARLTGHVSLPGRYVVYSPDGHLSGISRKLPDIERQRLKDILTSKVGEDASVIVRTAAESATEAELIHDVDRLKAQWEVIEKKVSQGQAPQQLYAEPDLTLRVVRDLFTEDFGALLVAGNGGPEDAFESIEAYVSHIAPHLRDRLKQWDTAEQGDPFAKYRIDEQVAKALERKVFLPSGGSLVIDRTEAMIVIDVNTGKFTGTGGNLEETVTKNNLEAAEEIVRQLRLRDLGGMVVIDFIDMVLPSNRELLLRRLVECLGRDRTRHQVSEVTSLGLVQLTRKRIGTGLAEAFTAACEVCGGRGYIRHEEPVESQAPADGGDRHRPSGQPASRRGGRTR